MTLINNVIDNLIFLKHDFTGFSINFFGIGQFLLHLFIAFLIFVVFYLFGQKIYQYFFKEKTNYPFFVNIALGYIVIATGVGILGAFSLLQKSILWSYLLLVVIVAFSQFHLDFKRLQILLQKLLQKIRKFKKDVIVWGVLLFVFIACLRLITPEITEDGYHTDLPQLYLATGTTILETKDPLHVIPYPQLAEMIYMIPISLGDKEVARFIHFGFYLLIIFLLFSIAKEKKFSFVKFSTLLFVTAPIVIRYSPSQYVDFFMVFAFLLAVTLIEKNMSGRRIILSGILFGSVFSVKMWTVVYLPAVVLYYILLNRQLNIKDLCKKSLLFVISAFLIALLWYVRAFIITGNPIYPLFTRTEYLEVTHQYLYSSYFGINTNMFLIQNMAVYSPIFFIGVVLLLLHIRKVIALLKNYPQTIFFAILMAEQLFIKVDLGRYLIAWYIFASIIISAGIAVTYKNIFGRVTLICIYLIMFFYYLFNTLFILPYGFGWANKNAYLTRVLSRDNANYYDFDHLFSKWISSKDVVATYEIVSYYYIDFAHIDINSIFSKENRQFDLLKKHGVTRLLINGGNIDWFCKQLALTGCSPEKVKLLATYPSDTQKYNLYLIQY